MVIPSVLLDIPIPTVAILASRAPTSSTSAGSPTWWATSSMSTRGLLVGTSIAYWGPPIKWGEVQPALAIDADAASNVDSLSFSFNNEEKSLPILIIQEPITKATIPIPVPDINPLTPPLGAVAADPEALPDHQRRGQAAAGTGAADRPGQGRAARRTRSTATGSLDVLRYGQVLTRPEAGRAARRGDRLRRAVVRDQRHP